MEGVDLLERKPTGFCDFDYRRYAFLNTTAFKDLHSRHKPIEMALLTVLIASIEQTFNICMQSSEQAHSTKSIAGLIGETPQSTRRKLKSLITGGVLYHGRVDHYKARPLGKVYVRTRTLRRLVVGSWPCWRSSSTQLNTAITGKLM